MLVIHDNLASLPVLYFVQGGLGSPSHVDGLVEHQNSIAL